VFAAALQELRQSKTDLSGLFGAEELFTLGALQSAFEARAVRI
jgi:hypothetical protein